MRSRFAILIDQNLIQLRSAALVPFIVVLYHHEYLTFDTTQVIYLPMVRSTVSGKLNLIEPQTHRKFIEYMDLIMNFYRKLI